MRSACILLNYTMKGVTSVKATAPRHPDGGGREDEEIMDEEQDGRWWIDIGVVQAVQTSAQTCVDDLLGKLTTHYSMTLLRPRRQQLIERTTSALLRIIIDELQASKHPE
jgi:hypothetical protein